MQVLQSELAAAVNELEQQYDELRELVRERLGDVFHAGGMGWKVGYVVAFAASTAVAALPWTLRRENKEPTR